MNITLCACGLLIFQPMARIHLATCATCIAHQADAPTDGDE